LARDPLVLRLAAGVVAVNAIVLGLVGVSLAQGRARYDQQLEATAQNLALVLETSLSGLFDKVDVALLALCRAGEQLDGTPAADARFADFLARLAGKVPEVEGFRWIDEDGRIWIGASGASPPPVSDRDYFRRARDQPDAGLIVSAPLQSRVSGDTVIVLGRRFNRADGSFGGMAIAAVPLGYFERLFGQLLLGKRGAASLRDRDFTALARVPRPTGGGRSADDRLSAAEALASLRASPERGTYKAVDAFDGIARRIAYRRISHQQLYVFVGLAEPDFLAPWWRSVAVELSLAALVLAVTLLAAQRVHRGRRTIDAQLVARQEVAEALKESEARYRTLVDHAPEAIVVCAADEGFRFVDVNEKACQLFEATREELLQLSPIALSPPTQPDGTPSEAAAARLTAPALSGAPVTFEWQNCTRSGRSFPCEVRLIRLPAGTRRLLRASMSDISDRKRAEEERERREAQMAQAQKMEAIGTLAGGIAHDFNNMLSAIKGYVELAAERCVDDGQREDLDQVRAAADRAAGLTRQILAFSRQSREEARPIQPRLVVKEALKLLRASIPSTIEIREEVATESLVLADPGEIHRIVVNLCTNAALAMEESGGVLHVRLDDVELDAAYLTGRATVTPGRFVRLTVKDSGCGMSDEVKARIFEPFFTTRKDGKGTGMGLSVVQDILTRRRGTASVASVPGKGSTFQIFLPVDTSGVAAAAPEQEIPALGTERVLFVDDEPAVAGLAVRSLGRLGYRVTACTSSPEALERFRAGPDDFDLVITDMTMPGMTGDRLAAALRAIRANVPIILCTGFSERISAERAHELGIDEFAWKPMASAELSRIMRRVLSARHPPAPVP
jgi:PAS domain S-box-containing protein